MTKRGAALILLLASVLAGCGRGGPDRRPSAPPPSPTVSAAAPRPGAQAPVSDADWTTYHYDNARSGVTPSLAPLGAPHEAWRADLDGAVYGQPLVVGDRVFAATENDTVYALEQASGRVVWSAHLGEPMRRSQLPCGNIDPLGITSTMVYDPQTGQLFALAETTGGRHTLFGLDAATGAVRSQRAAEPPRGDPIAHQQRGALTLLGGRIYIPYGGLAGDCAKYIGSVVALPTVPPANQPTGGDAAPISYAVPTSREGGIWAPGGAAVRGDRIYVPVGNGESTSGYDHSDSVLALTPDLRLVDSFSPKGWEDDNARDLDLGSMTPAIVGDHVLAVGKRGEAYALRADRLGGIGGQVATAKICAGYGAAAVDGDVVYLPCADGPRAVRVDASGRITQLWHVNAPRRASPVLGGGALWVVDDPAGVLMALDPATGAERGRVQIGKAPHFASPTLSRDRVYVGTMAGVVAVSVA